MAKDKAMKATTKGRKAGTKEPDWAKGLKRLYDSVVDEPLPESFAELLDRLDDDAHG